MENFYLKIFFVSILTCSTAGWSNGFTFIKRDKRIVSKAKKVKNKIKIYFDDIFDLIRKQNIFQSKFNLVFCDPPFKDINIEKLIELIFNRDLLDANGIIIIHRSKATKEKLPDCFNILDERTYGISKIIFGNFLS